MPLVDLRGREDESAVRSLLRGREPAGILLGWEDDGELAACAAVERDGADVEIRFLAAPRDAVGEALLEALADVATAKRLVATTDEAALDLYRACGFTFREVAPGRVRCVRAIEAKPAPAPAATLADVERAIRASWSRETSEDPDQWSEENSARGQCVATALVVRELLGGEILIANVLRDGARVERHAWNRLPSGLGLDLTREQFRDRERFDEPKPGEPMLTDPARCELLASRVRSRLGLP
jgi:hypothetical protein